MEKKTIKKPTTKKTSSKVSKTVSSVEEELPVYSAPDFSQSSQFPTVSTAKKRPGWLYLVMALAVAGVVLLALNRQVFLAAMVNGQPIFRWELNNILTTRYGQQTLEGMVTEKLVLAEAMKENVNITKEDIDKKAKGILESFGSALSVDEFLKMQGLSREEFENQLKLQMVVQQILSKDLTVTDADIANFIASNSGSFVATEPAKLREEAKNAIVDEHVGAKFQKWLTGLREKSAVQTY